MSIMLSRSESGLVEIVKFWVLRSDNELFQLGLEMDMNRFGVIRDNFTYTPSFDTDPGLRAVFV